MLQCASYAASGVISELEWFARAAIRRFSGAELLRRPQMVTTNVRVALVVGLLMTCASLFAHHGSATYDTQKVVVLKDATITKFIWANPHSIAMFDVKDDKGNVLHWAAEAGSPSALGLIGWTKNSLRPGDLVTVYAFQSKTGNPVGRLNKIVLSDGTTLRDSQLGDAESKDKSERPAY
jgi:hypothetical protein